MMIYKNILIIGLGLIGGSLAAAVKKGDPSARVYGVDVDAEAVRGALERKLVDMARVQKPDGTARIPWAPDGGDRKIQCAGEGDGDGGIPWLADGVIDLVVLAAPANSFPYWFGALRDSGYRDAVTDVASTKSEVIRLAKQMLPESRNFVPGHPMAGSEAGGIKAARADLFDGAYWILTPDRDTDPAVFGNLHGFLASLGARPISVDPDEHDKAVAIVSHIPHIAASSLAALVGKHAGENGELLRLAAGGFRDTTRVASGDPALWAGILMDNADIVAKEIGEFLSILADFGERLRQRDREGLRRLLAAAADLRGSIPKKWAPDSARLFELRIPMGNRPGVIAEITASAGRMGCNILSIEIDHQTDSWALLDLVLSDEGDLDGFFEALDAAGHLFQYSVIE